MKPGSSRRDFIRHALFGGAIGNFLVRTVSASTQNESRLVDRRKFGGLGTEISILGLGLGGEFMRGYDRNLDAGHSLLDSALAKGINYWDTARSYGPSEAMIAPVLTRNRDKVFLASKSDSRDYDGFKRDLERSLQVLRTSYIDLYHLHDMQPDEFADLNKIETGAVRAAREARAQKIIHGFGFTGHSGAGILVECMKRFDPDAVLTIFPATRPDKGRYEDELLPLARARKIGVVAMKTIRYGHQARLPATELFRYALGLDGVHCAIVGLDTLDHLNANAAAASNFRPLKAADRIEIHRNVSRALANVVPPWETPGYVDG
jgi:uncharacterized protein